MSDSILLLLIVLVVVCLIVTLAVFLLYSGLMSEVVIKTGSPPVRNVTIAYKYREGSYKDCGSTYTESCSIGPKLRSIGVFYDDPKQVRARCASSSCRNTTANYNTGLAYHMTYHRILCTLFPDKTPLVR